MADERVAAETVRRLAVQYQGLVEAAGLLEEIGSRKEAIASLEQQHQTVQDRLTAAQAQLTQTEAEAKRIRAEADQDAEATRQRAEAQLAEATAQAHHVKETSAQEARQARATLLEQAQAKAQTQTKQAQADVALLHRQLDELRREYEMLSGEVTALKQTREGVRAHLDQITAQMRKMGVAAG